ncbi:MAG: hypothetical protein NC302_04720 [Bacteroidales bacterium]|nr:hypothetical protein [Bacteroidales bacterium]MCM1415981.1 hypothetical protein [bacterium]MCM1422809.1 hypothetical protein [bacterium]
MAAGNSVNDEIKEQHQKAKDMSFKGKLAYFWDYYKIHTIAIVCAIVFIVSFVRQIGANKPYALYAVLLNAAVGTENTDTSVIWEEAFLEYAGIDPEAWQVSIDTSITLSADGGSQYDMANRQKMAAMMNAGDIHAIVGDTETFEGYAHVGYFYDLSELMTEEELAAYADLLYYTDAAAYDEDTGNTLEEIEAYQKAFLEKFVDHSDPAGMKQPVPVGVRIPASGNRLADAGYYRYLQEGGYTFQGCPSETVIGIPLSVEDPTAALQFIRYLTER